MKTLLIPVALLAGFLLGLHAQPNRAEVLLEGDRLFDRDTAASGAAGWASYFAPDGKMVRSNGALVEGREAIRALMDPLLSSPGNSLHWQPDFGDIAFSADLGYTSGTSKMIYEDPAGQRMQRRGRYLTVWRKQPGGEGKVAIDIGVSAEPEPATP